MAVSVSGLRSALVVSYEAVSVAVDCRKGAESAGQASGSWASAKLLFNTSLLESDLADVSWIHSDALSSQAPLTLSPPPQFLSS